MFRGRCTIFRGTNQILLSAQEGDEKMKKVITLLTGGFVFVILNPLFIVVVSRVVDKTLEIQAFSFYLQKPLALVLCILGLVLVISASWYQITLGRGTPVPTIPTQKLISVGPYRYCRNPMTLGTVLYYTAISIWLGSPSALMITGVYFLLFLVYIKMVEEKELEKRFGQEYKNYKEKTSFLIPKLW
jgi:protein-S-isoprenylcysteine O-methyltransferase Ste14